MHSDCCSHALLAFWCCMVLCSVIWVIGTDSVSVTCVSNHSPPVNIFLEVDDFGKGLCLWNTMPCVRQRICQQCFFHITLALRVRRAQPLQHNKLPVTFIPGHPCCFGAVAEGRAGGLEQQVSARADVEASASPARTLLTAVLQVERQPVWIYLPLLALGWEMGAGESSHWAKLLQWLSFQSVSPLVSIFKWKVFRVPPQNRDTAELQNIAPESCHEINI